MISSQCLPDGCSINQATHGAYEDLQVVGKQIASWSLATYLFVFAHTASCEEQLNPEPTQRSSLFFDLRLYLEPLSQRDPCILIRFLQCMCTRFALNESPELSSKMISVSSHLSAPDPGFAPRVIHTCWDSILIKSVGDGELSNQSPDTHKSRLKGITHRSSHVHARIRLRSNSFCWVGLSRPLCLKKLDSDASTTTALMEGKGTRHTAKWAARFCQSGVKLRCPPPRCPRGTAA